MHVLCPPSPGSTNRAALAVICCRAMTQATQLGLARGPVAIWCLLHRVHSLRRLCSAVQTFAAQGSYWLPKHHTDSQLSRAQACSFRDSYEDFCNVGATVVGVSKGDAASHQTFRKKHNLPFMLLCDEEDKVSLFRPCRSSVDQHTLFLGSAIRASRVC